MAAALLTAIVASITGIAASMYLGYQTASTAALAQHISIGFFSTMITLLAHSMMMFYFLGKGKAVKEAAAEGGLSKDFERRIAVVRAPVFSIATVAMLATMVTALLGASVDTGVVPSWVHRYGRIRVSRRQPARRSARGQGADGKCARRGRSQSAARLMGSDPLILKDVEKQYGGLRPLRVRDLRVPAGRVTMLVGFDRPAAEIFVNLVTGATLPESGEVISLGRATAAITSSDEWLMFVEQFGIVSDRIVLLETMTVAQNLAISFDLNLENVSPEIMSRVTALAAEAGIEAPVLGMRVSGTSPLVRSQVYLARALALDPTILLLEHPTANLSPDEANQYAAIVKAVSKQRGLTTVGLLMDETFAKATGGRLLFWQPATGEVKERFALRFW